MFIQLRLNQLQQKKISKSTTVIWNTNSLHKALLDSISKTINKPWKMVFNSNSFEYEHNWVLQTDNSTSFTISVVQWNNCIKNK